MFRETISIKNLLIASIAITGIASTVYGANAEGYRVDRIAYVRVASWDHLNVRRWPESYSQKVGELQPGSSIWVQRCIVKPTSSDWCKVSNGHMGGWVNSRFLEMGERL